MWIEYPKEFLTNVSNIWGIKGEVWLQELPSTIDYFVKKWQLSNLRLSTNLSYNIIIFAEFADHNGPVVLKLSLPTPDFEQEIRALKYYDGLGSTKLLNYDVKEGAMLLEAIIPGTPLKTLFPQDDDKAIAIAVKVMEKLHSKRIAAPLNPSSIPGRDDHSYHYPKLQDWLEALDSDHVPIPNNLMVKARQLRDHLLQTQTQTDAVLLHGDLHHDNILLHSGHNQNDNTWTSIDPKGVIGEPAFEVGSFIHNPIPYLYEHKNIEFIVRNRLKLFSKLLKVDEKRLNQWSFVKAMLSACWACEDNKSDNNLIAKQLIQCAEVIESCEKS